MTDVLRLRSVKPGYGRRWEIAQPQVPPQEQPQVQPAVQDHPAEVTELVTERSGSGSRLDYFQSPTQTASPSLEQRLALLEARIENERQEHERTRREAEDKLRRQQQMYEDLLRKARQEPRPVDKEVEGILELQKKLLQHKDEEIRHLSQIAAAHKEQLTLVQHFLKGDGHYLAAAAEGSTPFARRPSAVSGSDAQAVTVM